MKSRSGGGVPVVSAGEAAPPRSCPAARSPTARQLVSYERVQVDLEAVGDGVVVHPVRSDGSCERGPPRRGRSGTRSSRSSTRRLPGVPGRGRRRCRCRARARGDSALLQRPHHRRGDARGVPVHAHHRIRGPGTRTDRSGATAARRARSDASNALGDAGAELDHARREPRRHPAAVQRQVRDARALHDHSATQLRVAGCGSRIEKSTESSTSKRQPTTNNPQSTIRNPQPEANKPQSATTIAIRPARASRESSRGDGSCAVRRGPRA